MTGVTEVAEVAGVDELVRLPHDGAALAARRGAHGMVEVRIRFSAHPLRPEATGLAAAILHQRLAGSTRLRGLGVQAATRSDLDHLHLALSAPVAALATTLRVVVELVRDTAPGRSELRRAVARQQQLLTMARDDLGTLADEEVNALLYGADHPYGRRLAADRLDAVDHDDLIDTLAATLGGSGARLVAVGDAEPGRLIGDLAAAATALDPQR